MDRPLNAMGVGSKIGTALSVFTQFAGWAVALAGLAILQQCCNSNNTDWHTPAGFFGLGPNVYEQSIRQPGAGNPYPGDAATGSNQYVTTPAPPPSAYDCGMQFSWYWWLIALQFVCVLAGLFPAIVPYSSSKLLLIALYSIVTTQWCIAAYALNWMTYVYQRWGSNYSNDNRWRTGYTTAYAGVIIMLVANFLYLINLAAEEASREAAARGERGGAGGGGAGVSKGLENPELGGAGPGTTTTLAV